MSEVTTPVATGDDFAAFEAQRIAELTGKAPEKQTEPEKKEISEAPEPEKAEEAKTEPESDPGSEDEEQPEETEKPPKKGGFQRRIDRLTAEKRVLEAELARVRAAEKPKEPTEPKTEDAAARPKLEHFNSIEEWKDADDAWKESRRQSEAAQREAQKAQQALVERWNASLDQAREKHADLDEVLDGAEGLIFQAPALQALMESDNAGELAYWLAQHPTEARKIAGMNYGAANRELGKLELKLAAPPPPPKKVSSAPPPPKSVAARSTPVTSDPFEDGIDFREYERRRMAQLRAGQR